MTICLFQAQLLLAATWEERKTVPLWNFWIGSRGLWVALCPPGLDVLSRGSCKLVNECHRGHLWWGHLGGASYR